MREIAFLPRDDVEGSNILRAPTRTRLLRSRFAPGTTLRGETRDVINNSSAARLLRNYPSMIYVEGILGIPAYPASRDRLLCCARHPDRRVLALRRCRFFVSVIFGVYSTT